MDAKGFHESAVKLFEEKGATEDEKRMYLEAVLKDRGEKYISKLQKKYPRSLVEKARAFYEGLSPMEQAEYAEHFEKVLPAAIESDPERFTPSEIKAIFNSDGSIKSLTPGVFDSPARDVDRARLDTEGVVVEAPVEPPQKKEIAIPSPEQARTMNLSELRKFIPSDAGIEED